MEQTNPNVIRAEKGRAAVASATEPDLDLETAVSDTIADVLHLCDQVGLDGPRLLKAGMDAHDGDMEDGPRLRPST